MADYFSEYNAFIGAKGLPSPADTPYETPAFIRSKRSSRATTTGSRSREHSESPPPLPPSDAAEHVEKSRDGKYTALDPRRFTPTLHASLVSEILSLRRELDSKNHLVENLETTLAATKTENDSLNTQLSSSVKDVRVARMQVQQMESGTYEALDTIAKERNAAQAAADDLRSKLDASQKKVRLQDEDAERTQSIWEREKDEWEQERRQLERRVHVTETRLRTFVDEMVTQQAAQQMDQFETDEAGEEEPFKDSGIGNDSETGSASPDKMRSHARNISSASFRSNKSRMSVRDSTRLMNHTPEPTAKPGAFSLADELGGDDDDYFDIDEEGHADDDELDYNESIRRTMESRQSVMNGDLESKARRVLGLSDDAPNSPASRRESARRVFDDGFKNSTEDGPRSPSKRDSSWTRSFDDSPKKLSDEVNILPPVQEVPASESSFVTAAAQQVPHKPKYVDNGYQPSPPPSPLLEAQKAESNDIPEAIGQPPIITVEEAPSPEPMAASPQHMSIGNRSTSPISPPETPVVDEGVWPEKRMSIPKPLYSDMSTQTEAQAEVLNKNSNNGNNKHNARDSLQLPVMVPAIAIHPPTSRPSSPRPHVLPPGTKNAATQASLAWPGTDASVQTEEIRVDKRVLRLPPHLLPAYLGKSSSESTGTRSKRDSGTGTATILTKVTTVPASLAQPSIHSPTGENGGLSTSSRDNNNNSKDARSMPLKAILLPKPTLAPAFSTGEGSSTAPAGPLNRTAQFGVTQDNRNSRQLASIEHDSDASDYEDGAPNDLRGALPALQRPSGRFTPSEAFRNVPEDKELSPEHRRPETADSMDAAPAPSIASSRENAQQARRRPPPKIRTYANVRSRSPSFVSAISSNYSTRSAAPPFPIPTRSSSRILPVSHSEGSYSPSPDLFSPHTSRGSRSFQPSRQGSLRKVQSTTAIRHASRAKVSPRKGRRRLRSPDLTPVQSMAFESPAPTKFPIPELPTPLQRGPTSDFFRPTTSGNPPGAANSSLFPGEEHSLIDSIAATMVGEWMWKYIRKQKPFGGSDMTEDLNHNGDLVIPGMGSRHKRWVWLSPYERTIMWDNKQPTSGTALLGKKGRKLTIQSVIDVQDDTPLSKKPELESAFNRSILVLTPARALKFTATTAERHNLWMNALSFLAESGRVQTQLPPLPSMPPIPTRAPPPPPPAIANGQANGKQSRSPSFGKASIRDSVRLTKGKQQELQEAVAQNGQGDAEAIQNDGADFPAIPRLYSSTSRHQRKRSNTSPRLPAPLNPLRSFSSSAVPSNTSSNPYNRSNGSSSKPNVPTSSRGNFAPSPDKPNFFEAMGTVRMEAFVDPNVKNGVLYVPAPPSAPNAAPMPRRRRGDSTISASTLDKRRAGYVFDENGMDPFKGF